MIELVPYDDEGLGSGTEEPWDSEPVRSRDPVVVTLAANGDRDRLQQLLDQVQQPDFDMYIYSLEGLSTEHLFVKRGRSTPDIGSHNH